MKCYAFMQDVDPWAVSAATIQNLHFWLGLLCVVAVKHVVVVVGRDDPID